MADFYGVVGDRLPAITSQLLDDDGNPVDLTGATVRFVMRALEDTDLKVDGAGEVTDADAGQVRYLWGAADLDTEGLYLASWQVTFGDGRRQTYPGDRQLVVEVSPGTADAAAVDPVDLLWMREWVGSQPDDAALATTYGSYGSRTLAALSILKARRADLLADPLSYSIRGDVTVNAQGNLNALDGFISQLEAIAVADGDLEADADAGLSGLVLERRDTWGRGWPTRTV
jgi:hypothetical protein